MKKLFTIPNNFFDCTPVWNLQKQAKMVEKHGTVVRVWHFPYFYGKKFIDHFAYLALPRMCKYIP